MTIRLMDHPTIVIFDSHLRKWRRYANPRRILRTTGLSEVVPFLQEAEEEVRRSGLHAVGFLSYDAAPSLDSALKVRQTTNFPLLWFGLFESYTDISLPPPSSTIHQLRWEPSIARSAYTSDIAEIKREIKEGNTYQVNYTFQLRGHEKVDPWNLFLHMIESQQADYGAFLDIGDYAICSASPELFFRLDGTHLESRPMKGTAPRGRFPEEDKEKKNWLLRSDKNRAENVMIVDMIRNDVSRVALPGSVHVPTLCSIEQYPTVWQLTSVVHAQTNASVTDIFKAMFPCASVTGAPKASTMKIIGELEDSPRQIYTGAIGFISPGRIAQFNVAIRTALWEREQNCFEYGVGGGVVWQSDVDEEYRECMVKSRVITQPRASFSLVETMLHEPGKGYFLLEGHLARLSASAEYFGFSMDVGVVNDLLKNAALSFPPHPIRVCLVLGKNANVAVEHSPLYSKHEEPVRLRFAQEPVSSDNVFLFHKTTNRAAYDRALNMVQDCDDVLLWNERGELTETTIHNIVVEKDGLQWTPPVSCGLLGGVFRAHLVCNQLLRERVLTKDDVRNADKVFVINSVRRWRKARIEDE